MTTTDTPASEEVLDHAMFMIDGMGDFFGATIGEPRLAIRLLRGAVADLVRVAANEAAGGNLSPLSPRLQAWLNDEAPSTFKAPV